MLGLGGLLLWEHLHTGSSPLATAAQNSGLVASPSNDGLNTSSVGTQVSCPSGFVVDPTGTLCVPTATGQCQPCPTGQTSVPWPICCIPTPSSGGGGGGGGGGNNVCQIACTSNEISAPWPVCCLPNPAIAACQGVGGIWSNGTCTPPAPPPVNNPPPTNNPPPVNNPPPPPADPCAGQSGVQALLCQAANSGQTLGQGVCNPGYIQFAGMCIPSAANLINQLPVYSISQQGIPGCCLFGGCGPDVQCPPSGLSGVANSIGSGASAAQTNISLPVNSGQNNSGTTPNYSGGTGSYQVVSGPGPGILWNNTIGHWVRIV